MRLEDSDLDPTTAKPFTNVFSDNTTLDYVQAQSQRKHHVAAKVTHKKAQQAKAA
jgi:hypothetical protein